MSANHIYRVIWSDVLAAWIAVSEITCSRRKRSGKALRVALPLALLAGQALADGVPATVLPTGGGASAYISANGVPVVNIKAPNTAGLSHNQFLRYDVESQGLVLNNGNLTQINRQSQLAGQVLGNTNLGTGSEARVILNEVVSTNRSILAGFTEVVGGRADVVVANPNGITCAGCGFINTDRATLTTGTPFFNGAGGLSGFSVERGDILVQGSGFNASAVQTLDLLARSISVQAPVLASATGSLQLTSGSNRWSYDTRQVSGSVAGSGTVPAYAIDSSAVGGMYAGRIRLIATEAGVGVRMLGQAAATADDFRLDAAGQVLLQNKISAQRDIIVNSSATGANALSVAGANSILAANRNLNLEATQGDIGNEGVLLANNDLNVTAAGSIANGMSGAMVGLGSVSLTATAGSISNQNEVYAGTQLTAQAGTTLTNASSGTLRSDGNMTLSGRSFINNNWVEALNDISITTTAPATASATEGFHNEIAGGMPAKQDDPSTKANTANGHYLASGMETVSIQFYDNYDFWYDAYTVKEKFIGNVPSSATKPIGIVAGNNMRINYGAASAYNIGAVLSARYNLTLDGSGTLHNEAVALNTNVYQRRYGVYEKWVNCFLVCDAQENFYAATTAQQWGGVPYFSGATLIWPTVTWSTGAPTYILGSLPAGTYSASIAQAQTAATWSFAGTTGAADVRRDSVIHAGSVTFVGGGSLSNGSNPTVNNAHTSTSNTGVYDASGSLPTNPNAYFVQAKNGSARYLIETNPLYAFGSSYGGSDYLLKGLGIDPETTQKRLGDANYEAFLIKQQLIAQTGGAVLDGYGTQARQMERLMDQAVGQSKTLGLTFGKALSPEQVANLKQDIVWMVETTVGGEKVLAPVVYLAADSRQALASGAVVSGREINLQVASLSNTGGTITARDSLSITAQGDISNVSGAIKGGEVTLTSEGGSIINQTFSQGYGDSRSFRTEIGSTAVIESTGKLTLDAKKDINVLGAEVKAGGDASLTAGRNITVDSIVDKSTTISRMEGTREMFGKTGPTTSIVTTEKNIGSSLAVGGNLLLKSKDGDTTLAGTQATIGGNLTVESGGDFNVVSRQDRTTSHTESSRTGLGVGGGLWGTEKKTVDDDIRTNFGSSIDVGGNTTITEVRDVTVRGSELKSGGITTIGARSVTIEEGVEERHRTTRTESESFLSSSSDTGSKTSRSAQAEAARAGASASAGAGASASASSELNIYEKRTTTEQFDSKSGVASRLSSGGALNITATDKATVQGSQVDAGEALTLHAKNVEILAAEHKETTTITSTATKLGIYTDSKAEAKADASATATGQSASVKGSATAQAEASSTTTVGVRSESSTDSTTRITQKTSSLSSGTDMVITASEEAKFVGAQVNAGNNLDISARDITNRAAEESTVTTSSSSVTTAGIYLEGQASGKASAEARTGLAQQAPELVRAVGGAKDVTLGGVAKAGVSGSAEGSFGGRYSREDTSSTEGSSRAVVNTFQAGGNITRTAKEGTITDQGTQLDAGGDITQSAKTITEEAVADKTWSSRDSTSREGKIGFYGGGEFEAKAGVQTGYGKDVVKPEVKAEASAGVKGGYTQTTTHDAESRSTAVVSRYKAGGSVSSTSAEKTTLIGTQIEAGKDVSLKAGSLDYQAARDSSTKESSSQTAGGEFKAKATGAAGAELSGGYDQSKASSNTSTARAGSIAAKGNVTINTTNDARLEGSGIAAGNIAEVKSEKGNVSIEAAKSTSHAESSSFNVNANLRLSKKETGPAKDGEAKAPEDKFARGALAGGYATGKSDTTKSSGATISGKTVEISGARDVTLEGTAVTAGTSAKVTAGENVRLLEAKDSATSSALAVGGTATAGKTIKAEGSKTKQTAGGNVKYDTSNVQTGRATKIESGGDATVSGATITSQEAAIAAKGERKLLGTVKQEKLTNVHTGVRMNVDVDAVHAKKTPAGGAAKAAAPAASVREAPGAAPKPPVKKTSKVHKKKTPPSVTTAQPAKAAGAQPAGQSSP